METIRLTTYDGVELAANLYLPEQMEAEWVPGLIVCHGFGSRKERHAAFGQLAASQGFAALIMDLRGHGESGGELDGNVFNDVAAAHAYMQNRPEVNPTSIAVRGSSLGGWLAIHTAAHLKDVAPVVAICPTNEALLMMLMEEMGMTQRGHPSPVIPEPPPRVNVNSMMQLLYRLDLAKAARRIHPRPFLLIHCEDDDVVPAFISQNLYNDIPEPKTLWLLPDGNHDFAQHDPHTNERALEWLRRERHRTDRLSTEDLGGL